jgi:methionyl-tRNA formyltransferase
MVVAMLWLYTVEEKIIATTRLGFVNCHGGLLPKYRGNACANWAILNDEKEMGITVHFMKGGDLDSGPVILQTEINFSNQTTIGGFMEEFNRTGSTLVLNAVEKIRTGDYQPVPQDESEASYCYPRLPRDGEISWELPAREIHKLIRSAGKPYPGAYSYFNDVRDKDKLKKLVIHQARVESHPLKTYYAVHGHVIRLEKGKKWAVVCGDKKLIVLDEIEVDGVAFGPEFFFKTVRQRLGIDSNTLLYKQQNRIIQMEQEPGIAKISYQFLTAGAKGMELLEARVAQIVERSNTLLRENRIEAMVNPTRNYSFQKKFYDWEQKEIWFGITIYKSLRLTAIQGEPFALGIWFFGTVTGELEKRLYLSVKPEFADRFGVIAKNIFSKFFPVFISMPPTAGNPIACSYYTLLNPETNGEENAFLSLAKEVLKLK